MLKPLKEMRLEWKDCDEERNVFRSPCLSRMSAFTPHCPDPLSSPQLAQNYCFFTPYILWDGIWSSLDRFLWGFVPRKSVQMPVAPAAGRERWRRTEQRSIALHPTARAGPNPIESKQRLSDIEHGSLDNQ